MSNPSRKPASSPRPSDVARWVATLAAPTPDRRECSGAQMAEALRLREKARGALQAHGLNSQGQPIPPAAPADVKQAAIGLLILQRVAAGQSLPAAMDAVLGEGTHAKLVGDLYASLRARAAV